MNVTRLAIPILLAGGALADILIAVYLTLVGGSLMRSTGRPSRDRSRFCL